MANNSKNNLEKVTIIVLNFNGLKFLKGCFSSLKKQNYPDFEVIMADDCSTDDSVAFTKKNYPWVKIFQNKNNSGAPITFNNVIKQVKTELVVKIDNDIVADKNWLKEMVIALNQDPKVGLVGSKILQYKSDEIQDIGSTLDPFGYPLNYLFLKNKIKKQKIFEVFYVSGCSMLFRKDIFEKVGMFDNKFFIYKDDLDLCWRIKLLGYKIVVNLNSKMYHLSGVYAGGTSALDKEGRYHTTAKKRYLSERNTLRTLIKNYSNFNLLIILPLYFLLIIAESVFFILRGEFKVAGAYLNSVWWNIQNFSDTWKLHNKIRKMRIVPDKVIMKDVFKGSAKLKFLFINRKVPAFD